MEYAQDSTSVTLVGALFLAVMAFLTFRLPRKFAVLPLLVTTCYMPLGQMIVIAGLHFQFFRILLLLGLARVMLKHEGRALRLNKLDKLFIAWALATLFIGTLTKPSFERFINRSGEAFNAFGAYFLFRCWMRDLDDITTAVRLTAVMIVPLAISMIVERFTTRNIFSVFGGVPEFTGVREGKLRCQGAFRHPILAGTYGATLFPLCVGLFLRGGRDRRLGLVGAICAGIVTLAAASSGALMAMLGTGLAISLWFMRERMRLVRWGLLLTIAVLAVVMKAPVWYLFSRLSEITGGTGWYRSYLIDQAIAHFNEWWMVGSTYTAHWAPAGEVTVGDADNLDIINHFVAEGLGGGVVKLGLFITLIIFSFKAVGVWTARANSVPRIDRTLVWAFGACLLGHCISFMSVSYFDQIIVIWYWLLAAMAVISAGPVAQAQPVETQPGVESFSGRIFPQPQRSSSSPPGFQL